MAHHNMPSLTPLLFLVLISLTHALPFLIRQPSPNRGTCPSSSNVCLLSQTCCPNNVCCPTRTPFCTTSNFCVDARGRTRCPSADTGRIVLGTLCTSNTSNCCTPPFDRCSLESPVRCVNAMGQVRCIDLETGQAQPGVLCPDGVCCINQSCCLRDDGTYGCCPTGSGDAGRTLQPAPTVSAFMGETPVAFPTPSPMGSIEMATSSPSAVPTNGPQQPMTPTTGIDNGDMEEPSPSMTMEATMGVDEDGGDGTADAMGDGDNGDDDDDDGICLPADAKVQVYGKGLIRVEDLQTGDMVRVASDAFSRVFMWTHRDGRYVGKRYVTIVAGMEVTMTATEGHVVYVCRGMRKGCHKEMSVVEDVRVGDGVWKVKSGEDGVERVTDVKHGVRARGLFNPQTEHGDLVVDGMLATCYTKYVPVKAAHALLAPVRAMFRSGLSFAEQL